MAQDDQQESQRLVFHTIGSRIDMASIHLYNTVRYSEDHADKYIDFLHNAMSEIASGQLSPRPIEGFPELFSYIAKSSHRSQAHGYRIVFKKVSEGIEIIRVLHTRRDWMKEIPD